MASDSLLVVSLILMNGERHRESKVFFVQQQDLLTAWQMFYTLAQIETPPVALCASTAIFTPRSKYSTTFTKSSSLKLREVRAGAPVKKRTFNLTFQGTFSQ